MVRADLEAVVAQDHFEVLQHFLRSMDLAGDYALYPGLAFVWLAFELEADANRVVYVVDAREAESRQSEWAAMWTFDFDSPTFARVKSRLAPGQRSPRTTRRTKPK